jgi:hypothetical protein
VTRAGATAVFSLLLVLLGLGAIVETALLGGGIGFLLGALLALAGGLRLYLVFAGWPRSPRDHRR